MAKHKNITKQQSDSNVQEQLVLRQQQLEQQLEEEKQNNLQEKQKLLEYINNLNIKFDTVLGQTSQLKELHKQVMRQEIINNASVTENPDLHYIKEMAEQIKLGDISPIPPPPTTTDNIYFSTNPLAKH